MTEEKEKHRKADLEKVVCDDEICVYRGEYPRCYIDVYKNCRFYVKPEKWRARYGKWFS